MSDQNRELVNPVKTIDGKPIDSSVVQIDADTIDVGPQRYRLEGFNAPETAKWKSGVFIPPQYVGDRTEEFVNRIATEGEFTNLKEVRRDPAFKNRIIARQETELGDDLGSVLTRLGIVSTSNFSKPEDVGGTVELGAAEQMFSTVAAQNKLLQIAKEKQEYDAKMGVQYVPAQQAANSKEFAAIRKSVGTVAAAKAAEEIERLQNVLLTESMSDITRKDLEKKLQQEKSNLLIASILPDTIKSAAYVPGDRTEMNKAKGFVNQVLSSWNNATLEIKRGLGGILQIAGDEGGWDYLSKQGKRISNDAAWEQGELADVLNQLEDINTTDGPIKTVGDTGMWLVNNIASTIPLVGAMMGTSMVAGPMAGLAVGALPLSGSIYDNQPEGQKDAALALVMGTGGAVLERLGIEGVFLKNNILTKAGIEEATDLMLQKAGGTITREQAKEQVLKSTQKELVELARQSAKLADEQIGTIQTALRTSRVLFKGGVEGGTEIMQSLGEMVGATGQWNLDARHQKDFYEQLLNAGIAGTAIGATLGGIGESVDAARWHAVADGFKENNQSLSDKQAVSRYIMNEQVRNPGSYAWAYDENGEFDPTQFNTESAANFFREIETGFDINKDVPKKTNVEGVKALFSDPLRLARGLGDTIGRSFIREDGGVNKYRSILRSIIMGDVLPGTNYSGFKRALLGKYSSHVDTAEQLASNMGVAPEKGAQLWREAYSKYYNKNTGQLEIPDSDPNKQQLETFFADTLSMLNTMRRDADTYAIGHNLVPTLEQLMAAGTVRYDGLSKNKDKVMGLMMSRGASRYEANKAVEDILSMNRERAIRGKEAFHKYDIMNDPSLSKDVFEDNYFKALEDTKERFAAKVAHHRYLGENGETISNLLKLAKDNGEFKNEQEFLDTAQEAKDWFDITRGEYNNIDSEFLDKLSTWGTTLPMLAYLGKAGISSFPEVAMSVLGTRGEHVTKQLGSYWKNLINELRYDWVKGNMLGLSFVGISRLREHPDHKVQDKANKLEAKLAALNEQDNPSKYNEIQQEVKKLHQDVFGRSLYEYLGYTEQGYNAQSKFEYADGRARKAMQLFAKMTGLRAQTDATRIAAVTTATDTMLSMLESLRPAPMEKLMSGQGLSKDQFQSMKMLEGYGLDVPYVIGMLQRDPDLAKRFEDSSMKEFADYFNSSKEHQYFRDNVLSSISNMVDSKVVNPQAHNIPKYYHDPRFRIITTMTRFIAGLTSTVLPRLYRDYIKDGNVGMRYQAFSIIVGALAMSVLANALKDELAYGEESPYVNGLAKHMQRTVYGAGLLGRYEALVDGVMPLYQDNRPDPTKDPLGFVWDVAKDNSPPLGWADRLLVAASAGSEGDWDKAGLQALRAAPIIGSFPGTAKDVVSKFNEKED